MPQKKQKNLNKNRSKGHSGKPSSNALRIIGGDWRSRKLSFIDSEGLRPTPDRIRETLFNWLQGRTHGAYCLDLFAGSGALGLEALSRGAKEVVFVEKATRVASQLKSNLELLNSTSPVVNNDAAGYLNNFSEKNDPFDIIFLDPPFRKNLLPEALGIILEKRMLSKNGLIYLEHESEEDFDWQDYGLSLLKEASAGQVKSCLLEAIS